MPVLSRSTTKETLPRSRTLCTHPDTVTSLPTRAPSSQTSVRISLLHSRRTSSSFSEKARQAISFV